MAHDPEVTIDRMAWDALKNYAEFMHPASKGLEYRVTKQASGKYTVEGKGPNGSWMRTSNPDVQSAAIRALGG